MIKFTQLNLHKSAQATLMAGQHLEGQHRTIALLTEPHTIQNNLHGFPRGTTTIYYKNKKQGAPPPRAALVFSKDLNIVALDQWCTRDCAAGLLTINKTRVVLVSAYLDILKSAKPPWLDQLLTMASTKDYGVILGADTNAHSHLYGPDTNKRGEDIEDLIIQHNLRVANVGNTPTFETRRGRQHIQTFIDVISRPRFAAGGWGVNIMPPTTTPSPTASTAQNHPP